MNICKIWDADYPWDIRVEKVASSLAAAGHSVHLVCRNETRRIRHEWNGTFMIHRIPVLPSALTPAHTLWNLPYPLNPAWITTIGQVIRNTRADLIVARDILLALPAAIFGRIHRIPVVLDMAENYPAMLKDRLTYTPTGALGRLIRNPSTARLIERLAVCLVDHIIVVVEESRDRLVRAGVPPDRLTIVSNTPPQDNRWKKGKAAQGCASDSQSARLVYLGNLDGSRGLDVAIRAVSLLKHAGHATRLSVVGDGPSISQLRDLAVTLNVVDRVEITGRLPFSQVQTIMATADIGLIPHYATEAWDTTIPNKLFDYMALGLPVIVSEVKPAARIVRTEGCGEVFRDRDCRDLARCILTLANAQLRESKGRNGQAAIRRRYNWDHDSRQLLDVVATVGSRSSSLVAGHSCTPSR